jgi:hypothetical protein
MMGNGRVEDENGDNNDYGTNGMHRDPLPKPTLTLLRRRLQ